MPIETQKSFVSIIVLNGDITVKYLGGDFNANKGDSILIPAFYFAEISGNAHLILTELP